MKGDVLIFALTCLASSQLVVVAKNRHKGGKKAYLKEHFGKDHDHHHHHQHHNHAHQKKMHHKDHNSRLAKDHANMPQSDGHYYYIDLARLNIHPKDCVNHQPSCQYRAGTGQCEKAANFGYMFRNCPEACRFCSALSEDEPECADMDDTCPWWAAQGDCLRLPDYMSSNCKDSCELCGNATGTPLFDGIALCPSWASVGYCSINKMVETTCNHSCQRHKDRLPIDRDLPSNPYLYFNYIPLYLHFHKIPLPTGIPTVTPTKEPTNPPVTPTLPPSFSTTTAEASTKQPTETTQAPARGQTTSATPEGTETPTERAGPTQTAAPSEATAPPPTSSPATDVLPPPPSKPPPPEPQPPSPEPPEPPSPQPPQPPSPQPPTVAPPSSPVAPPSLPVAPPSLPVAPPSLPVAPPSPPVAPPSPPVTGGQPHPHSEKQYVSQQQPLSTPPRVERERSSKTSTHGHRHRIGSMKHQAKHGYRHETGERFF